MKSTIHGPSDSAKGDSPDSGASLSQRVAMAFDALVERADAFGENLVAPVVRVLGALVAGSVNGLRFAFSRSASTTSRLSPSRGLGSLLREAFSAYADALGTLAVLTIIATIFSLPIARLAQWGLMFVPEGPLAGHPIAGRSAQLLVELAFYFPLLTLGVGTIFVQRTKGEPIQPSRSVHAMVSNLPNLLLVQGQIAALPTLGFLVVLVTSADLLFNAAATALGIVTIASLWWLMRNAYAAPSIILRYAVSTTDTRRVPGGDLALFTIVLVGAFMARAFLESKLGCGGVSSTCWEFGGVWGNCARCLSAHLLDPMVCLVLMRLYSRMSANPIRYEA